MKKVLKIDNKGYFLEDVLIEDNEFIPNYCIETVCPQGFIKPKWDGEKWIEGGSINIEQIKQNKINELNQAMHDYIINNFYSSCLGTPKKFDCEQTDQIYIQGLVMKSQMILAGQQLSDKTTNWKESGIDICYHFEPIQCTQLGVDLSIHLTQAKEKKEKLVVYVKSLTDKSVIEAVTWDTVIPTN